MVPEHKSRVNRKDSFSLTANQSRLWTLDHRIKILGHTTVKTPSEGRIQAQFQTQVKWIFDLANISSEALEISFFSSFVAFCNSV